jgi:hypothetical protein
MEQFRMPPVQDEIQTLMTRQPQQSRGLCNRTIRVLQRHLNEATLVATKGFAERKVSPIRASGVYS